MKYVYIRQIIIIVGFCIAIIGSYFCMKQSVTYSMNMNDEFATELSEYKAQESVTGKEVPEIMELERNRGKVEIIQKLIGYGGSAICIVVGIIIVKKSDKILDVIVKK